MTEYDLIAARKVELLESLLKHHAQMTEVDTQNLLDDIKLLDHDMFVSCRRAGVGLRSGEKGVGREKELVLSLRGRLPIPKSILLDFPALPYI